MEQNEIDKLIELSVVFDTFKFIPRLGTKRIPIESKESVAIHIYEMIYLAYLSYHSMSPEAQSEIDLLKVIKLILWHEADESITNDIPYPAKKQLRRNGDGGVLKKIKHMVFDVFNAIIPKCLLSKDADVINETFDLSTSNEKKFAKFLDYVNLYLNCIELCNRGFNLRDTVSECKKLTEENEWYNKVPLVKELIQNPDKFINKEYN